MSNQDWWIDKATDEARRQRHIEEGRRIMKRLSKYYDAIQLSEWMHAKHPQLDGRTPSQCIKSDEVALVDAILDRLDGDVYL